MNKIIKKIGLGLLILTLGIFIGSIVFTNNKIEKTEIYKEKKTETKEHHWTCSMHPQIDLPEFGQCPICGMDLIPKEVNGQGKESENIIKMTKNAIALANIETMSVGVSESTTSKGFKLSGKIAENTDNQSEQVAHFGGRIEKLYVKSIGSKVRKGQLIAKIYSPDLVTAQNELLEAMYVKEQQPELYNAVRNKLKYWKLSNSQIDKIEQTKKVMSSFAIYSDFSGYVNKMNVQEGAHVTEGGALYNLNDLSNVWVLLEIYEKDIDKIRNGQEVNLKINAFPNQNLKAKISYIDPNIDESTRTAEARIVLQNKNFKFKPGMLVEASTNSLMKNNKDSKKIVIPKTAVLWTGKRSVVYVKLPLKVPYFELRQVVLGESFGNNIEILSGLSKGDEVAVSGVFTIDATAQLQGKKSMLTSKEIQKIEKFNKVSKKTKLKESMKCGAGKCGKDM